MNSEYIWIAITLFLALFIVLRTVQKLLRFYGIPNARSKLWLILIIGAIGVALVVKTSSV